VAQYVLRVLSGGAVRRVPELSREARAALERYAWPGNLPELMNTLGRVLPARAGQIDCEQLPQWIAAH
jgi:transcriptional regulator with PAS, ATPase and Fis domain